MGSLSYITYQNKHKWIKDLKVSSDTVRFLEENIRKKLLDVGLGTDFFYITLKV